MILYHEVSLAHTLLIQWSAVGKSALQLCLCQPALIIVSHGGLVGDPVTYGALKAEEKKRQNNSQVSNLEKCSY